MPRVEILNDSHRYYKRGARTFVTPAAAERLVAEGVAKLVVDEDPRLEQARERATSQAAGRREVR